MFLLGVLVLTLGSTFSLVVSPPRIRGINGLNADSPRAECCQPNGRAEAQPRDRRGEDHGRTGGESQEAGSGLLVSAKCFSSFGLVIFQIETF